MRGVNQHTSQKIVEDAGCFYSPSLSAATDQVLALVGRAASVRKAAR